MELENEAAATLLSREPTPEEILARLTPDKRREALWQRRGIVGMLAAECILDGKAGKP